MPPKGGCQRSAADALIFLYPPSAPIAGPIGFAAGVTAAAIERDPTTLIPSAVGSGVKSFLRRNNIPQSVSERISAGSELIVDQFRE